MSHSKGHRLLTIFFTIFGLLIFQLLSRSVGAQSKGEWQVKLQTPLTAAATALAYMPDGSQVAIGDNTGQLTTWDTGTGKLLNALNTHGKGIEAILFTSKGDKLIAISQDNKARIWTIPDWQLVRTLDGITATADVSPDDKWLACQDPDHRIWLWNLSTLKRDRQIGNTGTDGALSITFTPNGKNLALAYDYTPYLIDLQSKAATKLPVTAKSDVKVKQMDKNTYAVNLGAMDDDHAFSHSVRASRKGSLVAIGRGIFGKPDFVDIYDWRAPKSIARLKPNDNGTVTCFSSDNALLAIQGTGQVTVWEIATGQQVAKIKASGVVPSSLIAKGSSLFQFSPLARELAVVDGNNLLIYQER